MGVEVGSGSGAQARRATVATVVAATSASMAAVLGIAGVWLIGLGLADWLEW